MTVTGCGTSSFNAVYTKIGTQCATCDIYQNNTDNNILMYRFEGNTALWAATTNGLGTLNCFVAPAIVQSGETDCDPTNGGSGVDGCTFTAGIVPVKLTYFKSQLSNDGILLVWETASEEQNEGFEIQRSNDGKNWEKIDFVIGSGTTIEINQYSYIDKQPLQGENYYRLKQIDWDGDFEYSNINSIRYLEASSYSDVTVFPNPSKGRDITIINGTGSATLYNNLGQPIESFIINDVQHTMQINDFPSGHYILKILRADDTIITRRLVKE